MLFYCFLLIVWIFGIFFTGKAISTLGERNPATLGDSYTGDCTLDFWACLLWPLFWVGFSGIWLARVVFERFEDA